MRTFRGSAQAGPRSIQPFGTNPMTASRLLAGFTAAAFLVLSAAGGAAQQRRPLTPLDLYHLRIAGQPALSPDGRSVAYVVTQADSATNKYKRELWIARTDGSGAR